MPFTLRRLFCPHENSRPDGLGTGITAPYPARQVGHEKQQEGCNHQAPGQQSKILGPECHPEDVELSLRQIEQYGLVAVYQQPGAAEIADQQRPARKQPDVLVEPLDTADVNLLTLLVQVKDTGISAFWKT